MNTIKPFYIKQTPEITRQQVQDALDKCASLGVEARDSYTNTDKAMEYEQSFNANYSYFGVMCERNEMYTHLFDHYTFLDCEAIEITIDQLDEHLGIKQEAPWNGEGHPPVGTECEIADNKYDDWSKCLVKFIGDDICVVSLNGCEESFSLRSVRFRPLETPEQKKDREELEAAYDLYCEWSGEKLYKGLESFLLSESVTKMWLRVVRKTNYTPSDTMNG